MCRDVLQSCKIDPHELTAVVPKVLELGTAGRKLLYGPGVRARIDVPADQLDGELKGLDAEVVAALRLSGKTGDDTRFVTVGADHALVIWSLHGAELRRMAEHKKPVLGLWELSDGCIASWSEQDLLLVWRVDQEERGGDHKHTRVRIPARAASVDHIAFVAGRGAVCVHGWFWSKRVVKLETGKPQARFWWQSEPLTALHQLECGAYVTVAESGMKLRTATGRLLTSLPKFSMAEGYLSFAKESPRPGHFQIVDEAHGLQLMAASGARRGARAADEDMAKALRLYFKSHAQALKALNALKVAKEGKTKSPLAMYGFRNSPLCDFAAVGGEGQEPPAYDSKARQRLWSFFHRPRNARIQSWLLAETKAARDAEQRVRSARAEHIRRAAFARKWIRVAWWSVAAAMTMLLVCSVLPELCACREPSAAWFARFLALAGACALIWLYGEERVMLAGHEALSALPHHIADLLSKVAEERAQLRLLLPGVASPGLYGADDISKTVNKRLARLRRRARIQCGLRAQDLIVPSKRAFVLRDWAVLARTPSDATTPQLESFWWTSDGGLWLAVERIQVVFATSSRLHVYRADFDFVAKTYSNEESHVIRYDEIADVVVRDKSRTALIAGASLTVKARELVIVSKGGSPIALCALDQHSSASLHAAAQTVTSTRVADMQRNLKTEHQHSAPAHQKLIEAEQKTLLAESLPPPLIDERRSDVDRIFTQIKQLILGEPGPSGQGDDVSEEAALH